MSIILRDCGIRLKDKVILPSMSWVIDDNERWLVTGANGSGKSVLVAALAGRYEISPGPKGLYQNSFNRSCLLVSFEEAAAVIEYERKMDDSDFVEGGIDEGRTPRRFIMETLPQADRLRYPNGENLENNSAVILCGIGNILDRGIKFLSTGEIRRTLLCRALSSHPRLLILDEPFEGLDTASRKKILDFLERNDEMQTVLVMDRTDYIPESVTHIMELNDRTISFSGSKESYEKRKNRPIGGKRGRDPGKKEADKELNQQLSAALTRSSVILPASSRTERDLLVEMKNVTVEWSGRKVIEDLSWTLRAGEHWLIRGPNGSGKTTFLELITGDNPQVFRNDIRIFGNKRGSGESIWELKEKMGIVSYRLHTDYRAFGDLSLENVVLSGLHDSIGLYRQCGEEERTLAEAWLSLAGFAARGEELFRDLSYGEQRAILIARASIKAPPILILDEPCHGLDPISRERILTLLEKIAERGGTTLLHVTHDETEILPCEKHILELNPSETPMYRTLRRQGTV